MGMINSSHIELIGACTIDGAYGLGNGMPWPRKGLPGDMARFKTITEDAPEGTVNLLVAGKVTAETMQQVKLGPKRLLVSVSRKHTGQLFDTQENSSSNNVLEVRSFEEALEITRLPYFKKYVHKVIFIGGEASWKFAFTVARKAFITLALKDCSLENYTRLQTPLHTQAHNAHFKVSNNVLIRNETAWSLAYNFLDYIKE
jgi:dihydrofolate reductase